MTRPFAAIVAATLAAAPLPSLAQEATAWIEKSNAYTMQLLEMEARFQPEGASQTGLEQYDGLAMDLGPDLSERYTAAARAKLAEFEAAEARESDPLLKQDLQILIDSLRQSIEGTELGDRLTLDWYDIPRTVFGVMNGLLDDQIAPARRQTAKTLLERYTGLHPGTTPLVDLARDRWADSQAPGKVGPFKGSVEDTLGKTDTYISGIRELFAKYQIEGAGPALDAMERQLRDYAEWERTTVLPAAREDFRLPQSSMPIASRRSASTCRPRS